MTGGRGASIRRRVTGHYTRGVPTVGYVIAGILIAGGIALAGGVVGGLWFGVSAFRPELLRRRKRGEPAG